MKYALFFSTLIGLATGIPRITTAATLTAIIGQVPNARGHVRVAVCTKADFLTMHCAYDGSAPAQVGEVRVQIPNVQPGTYAVEAWHDANDNQRIDRNMVGIPTEALGFSRDARMWFGPPRFSDAALQFGAGDSEVRFSLRSFQ